MQTAKLKKNCNPENRLRLDALFYNAPVAYISLSRTGSIMEANAPALQLLGVGRFLSPLKRFANYLKPADRQNFRHHLLRSSNASTDPVVTQLHLQKKGRQIPVELRSLPFPDDALIGTVLIDRTQSEISDQFLHGEITRAGDILHAVKHPLLVLNQHLQIQNVNQSFLKLFRTRRASLINVSIHEMALVRWRDATLEKRIRKVLETHRPAHDFSIRGTLSATGEQLHFQASVTPVRQKKSKGLLIMVSLQDVAKIQKYQKEREDLLKQMALLNHRLEDRIRERTSDLQIISRKLIQTQEEERRYLARELHDNIGQILTQIKHKLEQPAPEINSTKKTELLSLLEHLVHRVKQISFNLRPQMVDDLGLLTALKWHAREFAKQTGLRVSMDATRFREDHLSPEIKITLYRIAQESLTNVIKHAKAKSASICLESNDHSVLIKIQDRGKGFVHDGIRKPLSAGLSGMAERATLFGGTFNLKTIPGKGTQITVKLPVSHPLP